MHEDNGGVLGSVVPDVNGIVLIFLEDISYLHSKFC